MEITLSEFNDLIMNYPVELKIIELNGKFSLGNTIIYCDEHLQDIIAAIDTDKNGKITYYRGGYLD